MTQEEKALLLQDLCARLPYKIMVKVNDTQGIMGEIDITNERIFVSNLNPFLYGGAKASWFTFNGDKIYPYLRPISSMTEEEVDQLFHILKINEENGKEWIKVNDIGIIRLFTEEGKDFYEIAEAMDYLHSIHIDYRGLISKGLAIAVTKENNPYKE